MYTYGASRIFKLSGYPLRLAQLPPKDMGGPAMSQCGTC